MCIRLLLILYIAICIPCDAAEIFDIFITNDKQLEGYLKFFDKLETCTKYEYNAERVGLYQIYGKNNNTCHVKWTFADCYLPEGIYQKFADIQEDRAIKRNAKIKKGIMIEDKDKDYRFLYQIGNQYCQIPLL